MENKQLITQRKMALIAGFSLVAMAIIAGFAYGYAFQNLYVAGDRAATLQNLNNSNLLFRLFILSFVLILVLDVVVAWALYNFFKQVEKSLSLLSAWLRLIYSALLGTSLLCLLFVLQLLPGMPQDSAFIMNSIIAFLDMWSLGLIVLSFHLFLLGFLMLKEGFIPKILGYFTLFAALCYLLSNIADLLMSDYEQYKETVDMILSLPMALGELGLATWLILKGGKKKAKLFRLQNSLSNSAQ